MFIMNSAEAVMPDNEVDDIVEDAGMCFVCYKACATCTGDKCKTCKGRGVIASGGPMQQQMY